MKLPTNLFGSQRTLTAFTFIELLAVVGVFAIFALLMRPALAGIQHKSGRTQCANNLRQCYIGSMAYANEYNDWLPVVTLGSANSGGRVNNLGALFYTRYVYSIGNGDGHLAQTNEDASLYQNLGFLYRSSFTTDGKIFYCPDQYGSLLGADYYRPALTTHDNGSVRSSYYFNPRMVSTSNNHRRYDKTIQLESHKLLMVDGYEFMAHIRDRGWNVLFTDGSVQFSQNEQVAKSMPVVRFDESVIAYTQHNILFDWFESDHQ